MFSPTSQDEIEKAHEDVLNILLQIMEDGILTDGKGRTVNFKNTILVMTSNIGSKRILETTQTFQKSIAVKAPPSSRPPAPSASQPTPISPEDALKKLQSNPKASSLLLEAASDPDIMGAVRTAMNGSPADLLEASRNSPTVANFLERLWAVIEEDGENESTQQSVNGSADMNNEASSSGLGAIRASIQASGLIQNSKTTSDDALYPRLAQVVKEELEDKMKPELLNRIDEIIVFSPLSETDLTAIARLLIDKTLSRARTEQEMTLEIGSTIVDKIVHEGSAKADQFGARPMRRATQRYVEDSLSDAIIQGFLERDESATMELVGPNQVQVKRSRDGNTLVVTVEDASGIDGGSAASSRVNGAASGGMPAAQPRTASQSI